MIFTTPRVWRHRSYRGHFSISVERVRSYLRSLLHLQAHSHVFYACGLYCGVRPSYADAALLRRRASSLLALCARDERFLVPSQSGVSSHGGSPDRTVPVCGEVIKLACVF